MTASPRGVVVLATDGLGWHPAVATIQYGSVQVLSSTFPSTSVVAWTSAITGADPGEHGLLGTVFRLPDRNRVVDAVRGLSYSWTDVSGWQRHTIRSATLFQRVALRTGARPIVIGREFDQVSGAWPVELFRGAERIRTPRQNLPVDAELVAREVIVQVTAVLNQPLSTPLLLWVYVNIDDHVHRHGYDDAVLTAVQHLDHAGRAWADAGWTVVLHADHGQTQVARNTAGERLWASLDSPDDCRLPSGGAGRVRWLYPKPESTERIAARLRAELGGCALVTTPAELAERGLLSSAAASSGRLGEIVVVATDAAFPVPHSEHRYEHGALTDEEVLTPFVCWQR